MMVAALRLYIDRARALLADRMRGTAGATIFTVARDQVDLVERLAFAGSAIQTEGMDEVSLGLLVSRGFEGRDPELEAALSGVSYFYHELVYRERPDLAPPGRLRSGARWSSDVPSPTADPVAATSARPLAFELALAHGGLVERLRSMVDPKPIAPSEAHARADEVWAWEALYGLVERSARIRRAVRLALRDDPTELLLMARGYQRVLEGFTLSSGEDWVDRAEGGPLHGGIARLEAVAHQVIAALDGVQVVYGRPAAPPAPDYRDPELALYRLALAHSRLRGALATAAAGGEGAPPAPWPQALAALDTGAAEVDRALLAALDDPAPRYRPARALGAKWSAYDETVARLPLGTLSEDGRGRVAALADEVAAHARAVVAAVDAVEAG